MVTVTNQLINYCSSVFFSFLLFFHLAYVSHLSVNHVAYSFLSDTSANFKSAWPPHPPWDHRLMPRQNINFLFYTFNAGRSQFGALGPLSIHFLHVSTRPMLKSNRFSGEFYPTVRIKIWRFLTHKFSQTEYGSTLVFTFATRRRFTCRFSLASATTFYFNSTSFKMNQ